MIRFIHTSDWQLGMTRHFLSPDAQARFTAARIDAIKTIGSLAESKHCPLVLVCGDVFESNHVERQVVVRALDAMAATPGVTFYLLPGNHDPLDASSVFTSPSFIGHKPANVCVLAEPGPVTVASGVELVAAPWSTKRPIVDLLAEATQGLTADGTVRVAVGHGIVDKLSPDQNNPALIVLSDLEASLASGAIHYVALGDRHSTTNVTEKIWYSGAPEPTDYRETDAGNALVVEVGTDSVSVERIPVGTWRFIRHDFELSGSQDCELVKASLDQMADKTRTIVKLALVGQLSLALKAYLDEILEHYAELFAGMETWERRSELVVLPDDDDFTTLELSGFASDAVDDLRQLAGNDDEQAVTARDALGLLYRLAGVPQ